jgi:imidazolonepropionase-like amidohydrolase
MPRARLLVVVAVAVATLAGCGKRGPDLVRRAEEQWPGILINDVSILDVETGRLVPHRNVLVAGDRIKAIESTPIPASGAIVVDGRDATLVPGLIDMHGHTGGSSAPPWLGEFPDAELNLRAFLYCGVTTVLDPGDLDNDAFKRRERLRRGELLGPHVYAAGPLVTAPGGHPVPVLQDLLPWWIRWYLIPHYVRQVDTPEEARKAAIEIAELGADVMKVVVDRVPADAPRIRNDVLAAAVEAARSRKLRAVAHIGTTEDAIDAARAGIAMWMHGVYRERIPDEAVATLAAFHIPMVATIGVFESYSLFEQGPRVATPLERETVDAETLGSFDHVPDGFQTKFRPFIESLRPLRPVWRDNVRRLHAAGVTILAGSDVQSGVFPGAALHRELGYLTEAGFTNAEAIRAATLDAARFLADGREPDFGIVAVGKRADLLLVDGDPTQDLAALSHIKLLLQDGVLIDRIPLTSHDGGAT